MNKYAASVQHTLSVNISVYQMLEKHKTISYFKMSLLNLFTLQPEVPAQLKPLLHLQYGDNQLVSS